MPKQLISEEPVAGHISGIIRSLLLYRPVYKVGSLDKL